MQMPATPETSARALLDFYLEAGADALVGETPVNRFTQAAPAPPRPQSPAQPRAPEIKSAPQLAPPAPDAAAMEAREAVQTVTTLERLRAALERFEGCALRSTATQLVFADGNPQAKLMLV